MLKVAEMAQCFISLESFPRTRYETAHKAQISHFGRPETAKCVISALLAAQHGPCGPHRPIVRAGAAACEVELTTARRVLASALARQ